MAVGSQVRIRRVAVFRQLPCFGLTVEYNTKRPDISAEDLATQIEEYVGAVARLLSS